MKTITLQEFNGVATEPKEPVVLTLANDQEALVAKHGWPDAIAVEVALDQHAQLYTLEDWNGNNAIYTKVNSPLFLCLPSSPASA
jgi:hypothetical protein